MFDWDDGNLRKIRAHRIKAEEVETALSNDPILIYEQTVEGEVRYVYYGETDSGRLLAVVLRAGKEDPGRDAYDLDAGQKRDYLARRLRGGVNNEEETDHYAKVCERGGGGRLVGKPRRP